ncbi:GAF domain-containing sensor histidine kinase [Neiella marina]|uniref:histidine kinase n=1 Tax=Neiella holothuriorum TaxID=2870530 RepID=A0ABS7EKQ8_9GAMM|nr:GAF domain-containing sensor histidine kinase [Neiella holothuriorum]MBW8192262.1 GAF domain-containing sensor histidine kinase [Neiella holothuriorum]
MGELRSNERDAAYWQRLSQLEAGRAAVLRSAAQGEAVEVILNTLCAKSEQFNPAMKTSVLSLNQQQGTLHPIASVSLPQFYCDALDGVHIGMGVGSCGTAAFSKKRVIVEDINTHPYWSQYKQLALSAGLQACWSEPIVGAQGRVFGTFAIYYDHPQTPTEDDLQFIETSANLAAVVFENWANREQLLEANRQLSQTVDARTEELKTVNQELSALITKQQQNELSRLETEKQATITTLLTGVAHELNTPLGVALTAISCSHQDIQQLQQGIEQKTMTQSEASRLLHELEQKAELTETNIAKSSELIRLFKRIDSSSNYHSKHRFNVARLLKELQTQYRESAGFANFAIEVSPSVCCQSKYAFWQMLTALVENSLVHGFDNSAEGHISIGVSETDSHLHITYHDDGKGIADIDKARVFDPFYSPDKAKGKMGLGLNLVRNIIYNVFHGTIQLVDSPVGVRFQISIPR